ncbi:MAG TPA: DUF262 domain-containing protein, partial [Myxococcales bacterium]|nr:DUF262 domain-containing protein [Myxococcales bacterium]
ESVLHELPAGAMLVLEVDPENEPFVSRPMQGAPKPTCRVTEHLLDGQQRLTALWRSLHDDYPDRTYFVYSEKDDAHGGAEVPRVYGEKRYERGGRRFPDWANVPAKVLERGLLPVSLLRPGDLGGEISAWCESALGDDHKAIRALESRINKLRDPVKSYNLPFLSLPRKTPKDVALNVFIQMNTSSVPLSSFDIVVAQVEATAQQSLHDLVSSLKAKAPTIERYEDPSNLVLQVASLRQDKTPGEVSFFRLDFKALVDSWDSITRGIAFAAEFLEKERIFDATRLPTTVVLPVLAALHDIIPEALDGRGMATTILRKYVWRAFVTKRYERSAATAALQDYRTLRAALPVAGNASAAVPIFDEAQYPLPTTDELKSAGWPKRKDILARAILALSLRQGALDLADGTPVDAAHLSKREYHHLFPDALLSGDGSLEDHRIYRALNCALITWNTNRNISAKEPIRYLKDRVERAHLGEAEIVARLATHIIPFDKLNVGGYADVQDPEERQKRIEEDYETFLDARATLIREAMKKVCDGYA